MKTKKLIFVILVLSITSTACQPTPTQTPTMDVIVTNVTENDLITGEIEQIKTFDQCESSSAFRTEVQFSNNSAKTSQQQLVLGAEVKGGIELPTGVKAEISGSIQKHFSDTVTQGQAHYESVSIEVPAHTQQVYKIVWQETRSSGTVTYEENGEIKSMDYSYRIGLEMVSASSKDIPCQNVIDTTTTLQPTTPAPVILEIQTDKTGTAPNRIIFANISFRDEDGDAYIIKYELSKTTIKDLSTLKYSDDLIPTSSSRQVSGATIPVQWNCAGTGYTVTFNVVILDNAGNQSNKFPVIFDCRG